MSATEDVAGVVQTAADELQKMIDTLAEIFEHLKATEEAAKAAGVQEKLLEAIKDLKEEIAGLAAKPGDLTPGILSEVAAKGEGLAKGVMNPGEWQEALPSAGAPRMAEGPLAGLAKGGPPGLPGLEGAGPELPALDAGGGGGPPGLDAGGVGGIAKMGVGAAAAGPEGLLKMAAGGGGGGAPDIAGLAAGAAGGGAKLVGEAVGFIKGEKGKWMRPEGGPVIGGHRNAQSAAKQGL